MPHVVLKGRLTIEEVQKRFEPFVFKEGDLLVKVDRFYCERDGHAALLDTVVVERGHTQKFFIQLSPKAEGLTIRLEPLTDPEKTSGVRRAIALVAHRIREVTGCAYGRSNIEDDLVR